MAVISAYSLEYDHEIQGDDYLEILELERSARCRHTTKVVSRFGYSVTPCILIFASFALINTELESITKEVQNSFINASFVVSGLSLMFVVVHLLTQLDEQRILSEFHRKNTDQNSHILGHDRVSAFAIFLLVSLNIVKAVVTRSSALDNGGGVIPMVQFQFFMSMTFYIQCACFACGWTLLLQMSKSTINSHLRNTDFVKQSHFVPDWKSNIGFASGSRLRRQFFCACWSCMGRGRWTAIAASHVCDKSSAGLCGGTFGPCCCKIVYEDGRTGRRAIKRDYASLLKKREDLTQRPGWRKNPSLLKRVKQLQALCSKMRADLAYRKQQMNHEEEVMVGSVEYCRSLEEKKIAYDKLMEKYPDWKGIPKKKQKSWAARIKHLHQKINTGGINLMGGGSTGQTKEAYTQVDKNAFHVGVIETLKKRKRRIVLLAHKNENRFSYFQQWKDYETTLERQLIIAKSIVSKIKAEGALRQLKSSQQDVAKNRKALHRAEEKVVRFSEALAKHRDLIDEKTGSSMAMMYHEIHRSIALSRANTRRQIVRVNMSIKAAVTQVNWLFAYRRAKFHAQVRKIQKMHSTGDHSSGLDSVNRDSSLKTALQPPAPMSAPSVSWPQEVDRNALDSPSTNLVLQWYDHVENQDDLIEIAAGEKTGQEGDASRSNSICGYKLLVFRSTLQDDAQDNSNNDVDQKFSSEKKEDGSAPKEDDKIKIGHEGGAQFVLDKMLSRNAILFDDNMLTQTYEIEETGKQSHPHNDMKLGEATTTRKNTLRVTNLRPNTAYRFQICTLAISGQASKQAKKLKFKKRKKIFGADASFIESRPSHLTHPKLTSVDYPSRVLVPQVQTKSINKPDHFAAFTVTWSRPQEHGIEIEGYKLECRCLEGARERRHSLRRSASSVSNKGSEKESEFEKSLSESGGEAGVLFHSSGTASSKEDEWVFLKTIPHDDKTTVYSTTVYIGEDSYLKEGLSYQVRLCSFLQIKGEVRYVYYVRGEESAQFKVPHASKTSSKKGGNSELRRLPRKSSLDTVKDTLTRNTRNQDALRRQATMEKNGDASAHQTSQSLQHMLEKEKRKAKARRRKSIA